MLLNYFLSFLYKASNISYEYSARERGLGTCYCSRSAVFEVAARGGQRHAPRSTSAAFTPVRLESRTSEVVPFGLRLPND